MLRFHFLVSILMPLAMSNAFMLKSSDFCFKLLFSLINFQGLPKTFNRILSFSFDSFIVSHNL